MTVDMISDAGGQTPGELDTHKVGSAEIHGAAERSSGRPGRRRGAGLRTTLEADRAKAFRRARWHTWLVRGLKLLLPVGVVSLVAGYGLILSANQIVPVRKGDKFDIGTPTLNRGVPSMKNPRYEGYNKDGSKFFVTAKQATPDFSQPDKLTMKSISGTFTQVDKVKTYITAGAGLFDNKKSVLDLYESIDIVSGSGLQARLNSAKIYLKANRVVSVQPVAAQMPAGTIRANAMTLLIKKRQAEFTNGVAVMLKPKPAKPALKAERQPGNPWAAKVTDRKIAKSNSAGFGGASNAPIDVVAMTLYVDDIAHTAKFKGSVRAVQSGSTMTADGLDIFYEGTAKKDGKSADQQQRAPLAFGAVSSGSRLKRITATGRVIMNSANGRTARARTAEFDALKNTATLNGNVVLTQGLNVVSSDKLLLNRTNETALLTGNVSLRQGENLLRGGRLLVNRKSATSQLTSPGAGGRIFATFYQNKAGGKSRKRKPRARRSGFAATQFKTDPDAPIKIIADRLDIDDKVRTAIFKGKVVARQGGMAIRATTLVASYSGQNGLGLGSTALNDTGQKTAAAQPPAQLTRVKASGSVEVSSEDGQRATGDWADFDIKANSVTLGGNVKLIQGSTELFGERLEIDMGSGRIKLVPRKGGSDGRRMSLGGGRDCTRACLQIVPGQVIEQFKRARGKKGSPGWGASTKTKPGPLSKRLKSIGEKGWEAYQKP